MLYDSRSPGRLRGSENDQSRPGKEWDGAHLVIGYLDQLDDAVGKVQVPLWFLDVVCEVHHGFRGKERIYNHVLNRPCLKVDER